MSLQGLSGHYSAYESPKVPCDRPFARGRNTIGYRSTYFLSRTGGRALPRRTGVPFFGPRLRSKKFEVRQTSECFGFSHFSASIHYHHLDRHHPHPPSTYNSLQAVTMASLHCANAPSAARSFIQLARRSYSTTASQSSTPLEFLVPRCAPSPLRVTEVSTTASRIHIHTRNSNNSRWLWRSSLHAPAVRAFSTSAARQQTRAILNPQQDEDGNEMMLEITERAAKVCRAIGILLANSD